MRIYQKDLGFVLFIWVKFNSLGIVGARPDRSIRMDKSSGQEFEAFQFATFNLPYFTELHHQWYPVVDGKRVKVLPSNIASLITPRALAHWLSGDGSYCKSTGRITISTDSFTAVEVDTLRSVLLDKLNIESARAAHNKAKEQYVIRIPKREVPKVQQLVANHIPSMMRHRVGL